MSDQPVKPQQPARVGSNSRLWVQVCVVIAILFFFGVICVTGVVRVREHAASQQCKNNLRSIGFAIHNYHNANNHFPEATTPNPDLPPELRLSWMFELDPYIHARMDPNWWNGHDEAWDSETNLKLARGRMPSFQCPTYKPATDANGLTIASYVGLTGVGVDATALPERHPRGGALNYERGVRLEEFTDTVESLMVIETSRDNGPWTAGGPPTARPFDPDGSPPVGRGRQFGGLHPNGVYVMYADSHAFFVRDTVSPEVLAGYITIAGQEALLPLPE